MTRVSGVFELRFVRRLALPFHHRVPIDVLEELVFHHELWVGEALSRVFAEESTDEVPDGWRVELLPLDFILLNSLEQLLPVSAIEWWQASYHLVQEYAEAPPVYLFSICPLLLQGLGSEILSRAAETVCISSISHVLLR